MNMENMEISTYAVLEIAGTIRSIERGAFMDFISPDCLYLRQESRRAPVDGVLATLVKLHEEGELTGRGDAMYAVLNAIRPKLNDPRHASILAAMLSWDEVIAETDRSTRELLVEVVSNIGDQSHVISLVRYIERMPEIPYPTGRENFRYADSANAYSAIARVVVRSPLL